MTITNKPKFWQMNLIIALLIALAGGYLLLKNLDNSYLWQDEAETACISRTVLSSGVPRGYDGLNYYSQQEGREYGEGYVWKLHPWFQFYLQALFFGLFGYSTFVARLPFALLGVGGAVFMYFLAMRIWNDRKTAIWSVILCLISVTFLLLMRQARYYAPVFFFTVYATWSYWGLLAGKRRAGLHYAVSTFLLFHSHYLFAMTFWLMSGVYVLLAARGRLKSLLLWAAAPAVLCLPYLWWLLQSAYVDQMSEKIGDTGRFFSLFNLYSAFIFRQLLSPLWLVVPAVVGGVALRVKQLQLAEKADLFQVFLLGAILINTAALAALSEEAWGRYFVSIIPFVMLLKGRYLSWLTSLQPALPLVIVGLLVYVGYLDRYIPELRQKYNGPVGGLVRFLKMKSKPGDTIAITYGDLPLKFYLPDRKIYGGLTGEDMSKMGNPQFVVVRHNIVSDGDTKVRNYLTEHIDWTKYFTFQVNVEDYYFENREVPDEHIFATLPVNNPLKIQVRADRK